MELLQMKSRKQTRYFSFSDNSVRELTYIYIYITVTIFWRSFVIGLSYKSDWCDSEN